MFLNNLKIYYFINMIKWIFLSKLLKENTIRKEILVSILTMQTIKKISLALMIVSWKYSEITLKWYHFYRATIIIKIHFWIFIQRYLHLIWIRHLQQTYKTDIPRFIFVIFQICICIPNSYAKHILNIVIYVEMKNSGMHNIFGNTFFRSV